MIFIVWQLFQSLLESSLLYQIQSQISNTTHMPIDRKQLSEFDSFLYTLQQNIFTDFFGPKLIPMRYIINFFKGTTFIWVLFLMQLYQNHSTGMYLYLVLHGSYGMFWVLKDLTFPDPRFQAKCSLGSSILCVLFLTLYWMIPVPLAAGLGVSEPSTSRIIFLLSLYFLGLVLMLGSDYQKYHALKQKPGLISTGFFKLTRNPNYLGEIMIYSSFVLCSGHSTGFIIFYGLACTFFALNIYLKDKTSYELKQGWQVYKKQSYILLPKVLPSFYLNVALYSVGFIIIIMFLGQQHPQTFGNYEFSHLFKKQMIQSTL